MIQITEEGAQDQETRAKTIDQESRLKKEPKYQTEIDQQQQQSEWETKEQSKEEGNTTTRKQVRAQGPVERDLHVMNVEHPYFGIAASPLSHITTANRHNAGLGTH